MRVRFAPSPTGNLHVGGARTALFNWLFARKVGGKFVVRVEDTDRARSTLESERVVLRDLAWLGLDWDEGPEADGGFGPYRQSERTDIYRARCDELIAKGLAYPCFCTDDEITAMKEEAERESRPPVYTGRWAHADAAEVAEKLAAGEPHAVRFRVPQDEVVAIEDAVRGDVKWNTNTLGDFVILRSNGLPVYNFCVAVDDAAMEITHVIRAEEHLPNTLRQVLIYRALGLAPPKFCHVSLILAPDRSKLSKRHGATSVGEFQQEGFTSDALVNYLATLGWNDGTEQEIFSRDELVDKFSLERITKSAAVFDKTKLSWVNAQHLRALDDADLSSRLSEAWVEAGVFGPSGDGGKRGEEAQALVGSFVSMCKETFDTTAGSVSVFEDICSYPLDTTLESSKAKKAMDEGFWDIVREIVACHAAGEMDAILSDLEGAAFKQWMKGVGKKLGRKGKQLFLPMRIAMTGRMQGPDVGASAALVKRAEGVIDQDRVNLVTISDRVSQLEARLALVGTASNTEDETANV